MELLGRTLFPKRSRKRILNIGAGNVGADRKPIVGYEEYQHVALDIDPKCKPDICCDALDLRDVVKRGSFDAVFCSHNLEHYYHHHVPIVLSGMYYVLKPGGIVDIRVPDIIEAVRLMQEHNLDINDYLYIAPAGPISTIDVIYGWRLEIERSSQPWYAHKTAFTPKTLHNALTVAGFTKIEIYKGNIELKAIGYKGT